MSCVGRVNPHLADSSARNWRMPPGTGGCCQELEDAASHLCDHSMTGRVTCSWPPGEKHTCNECIWCKGKCTIGRASVTQRAPHRTGPVHKKVHVMSQLTIEEGPEEATGEAVVTQEAVVM